MTRSDLVAELAERFGQLTHRDTEFAVKTILDAMSDALARGHRIEIRGFGSFSINRRAAGSLKYDSTPTAMMSPIPRTAMISSCDAEASASIVPKWRARICAAMAPT